MQHETIELPYKPIFSIITVSTSRFNLRLKGRKIKDESGDWAEDRFRRDGIEKIYRYLVPDDLNQIIKAVEKSIYDGAEVILVIGGSGISPSDVSYKALKCIIEDEVTSYPYLFISFSIEDIGSKVLPTRLVAGFHRSALIFLSPGSVNAVKTAIEKIIIKEYRHLLWLRNYYK